MDCVVEGVCYTSFISSNLLYLLKERHGKC
jgi:hypothetical protein